MPGGPNGEGDWELGEVASFLPFGSKLKTFRLSPEPPKVDPVIPPRRHRKDVSDRKGNELHNLTVVLRIEMPHGIAIDEIDRTSLPALNQKLLMKDAGRTIGQKKHTTGTQVRVAIVEGLCVVGSEIVAYAETDARAI